MQALEAVKEPTAADKIECKIDGAMVHSIQVHLRTAFPNSEWTIERYQAEYPNEPLFSEFALLTLEKDRQRKAAAAAAASKPGTATITPFPTKGAAMLDADATTIQADYAVSVVPMHDLFGLGAVPAALGSSGNPIPVQVLNGHTADSLNYLTDVDEGYVYDIELLKAVLVGIALNKPTYLWGMHGTGKTTVIQQVGAHTKRPTMRVQHTINMEESHVLGQWVVKDGETKFQLGPLPLAMLNGWIYIADEYDFAMPSVTALYQPVMEGQALVIKDAPPHLRKIVPHKEFRFFATGNTNGCGDETGLYQGTLMQNSANYSRFGITSEVHYMKADIEENILTSKAKVPAAVAKKFVKFANDVRKEFTDGKLSMTISTRELLSAAEVGIAYGGNWKYGVSYAFANRLPRVDRKTVEQYIDRVF